MSEFDMRRAEIVSMAAGPQAEPETIDYTPEEEEEVWRIISSALEPIWDRNVAPQVLAARDALNLPQDNVPQLTEITERLRPLSGFKFHAVGGLVEKDLFFGGLARGSFLSTQYLRHPNTPLYTEEPDIVHEVIGHGTLLADRELAELHRLAGAALTRVETETAKQFIANVWWFSGEFGVLLDRAGARAFGAGLLSSAGELERFGTEAEMRPLDICLMGLAKYEIDKFQRLLFTGQSIAHVMDVVGGFFDEVTDGQVAAFSARS